MARTCGLAIPLSEREGKMMNKQRLASKSPQWNVVKMARRDGDPNCEMCPGKLSHQGLGILGRTVFFMAADQKGPLRQRSGVETYLAALRKAAGAEG